jgi:hypothetical protein
MTLLRATLAILAGAAAGAAAAAALRMLLFRRVEEQVEPEPVEEPIVPARPYGIEDVNHLLAAALAAVVACDADLDLAATYATTTRNLT